MLPRLCCRRRVMGLVVCFCFTAATQGAPQASPQNGPRAESGSPTATKPNYSKEPFVIDKLATDVTFAASGIGSREVSLAVHLQTEEAVRQFGVLNFPYDGNAERVDVAYVRVRKPDGSVVNTPPSNFQDLPSEIVRAAPTYSDLRETQIPVKALGTGDVLEYLVRFIRTQSIVPGHFWYAHNFSKDAIVLEETLRIVVPAGKYVKIMSPEINPEIHSKDGQQIYFWKTAQLSHPAPKNQKMQVVQAPSPAVQLTTFKSWEEVGEWYGRLQSTQAAVTPAIQAKADELTKGLTSSADKLQAIYHYVATKFRYVSISFGVGRYQPHKAEDVLSNQYGDCKDKHTLFAALLKAEGFDAWPALIGSGLKLDRGLPSLAQFNHLITVVPNGANREWLDTTPELAPYGMLMQPLRDQQALVILTNGSPTLMTTPADPPFPSSEKFEVQGALNGDGTFTGHVDVTLRGDQEVAFRTAFRQTPPTQWLAFAQNVSTAYGFSGTVSSLNVDGLDDTRKPFHYAYDYLNKHYSDWENRRIIPPFPVIAFQYGENDEQPVEPIYLGAPREIAYRATMRVPEGYSADLPANAQVRSEFGEYKATYGLADGVLTTERRLSLSKRKLPANQWQDFLKFEKAIYKDEGQVISMVKGGVEVTQNNDEAAALIEQAMQALQNGGMSAAHDALARAERLNPKQRGLWTGHGYLYFVEKQFDKSIAAYEKEIKNHPDDAALYKYVAQTETNLDLQDKAIESWRGYLKLVPNEVDALVQLSRLLNESNRSSEALDPAEQAVKLRPDDFQLQALLAEVYLRIGRKKDGLTTIERIGETSPDSSTLNNIAYILAETNTELHIAKEYAEKAVSAEEENATRITLSSLTDADMRRMVSLAASWDTLGWIYFRLGDLENAEKYINASWMLTQFPVVGVHLGQVYERQGKKEAAIEAYELALAAAGSGVGMNDARDRLKRLGAAPDQPVIAPKGAGASNPRGGVIFKMSPAEKLGRLRSTDIPFTSKHQGTAEFFLLFSSGKVTDVQFITGAEILKKITPELYKAHYNFTVPDTVPIRVVRRGVLACSALAPRCQLVLVPPGDAKK